MVSPILSERTIASMIVIERRAMDKVAIIMRQDVDPTTGLQRGALVTIQEDVPCSVGVPFLLTNPYTTPGRGLQGGAAKSADRIITFPLKTDDGEAVDIQEKDVVAIDGLLYDIDTLALDASFPTSIPTNAELRDDEEEE